MDGLYGTARGGWMKVVFLFMSQSSASPGATRRVIPKNDCHFFYHEQFAGEGYFALMQRLVDMKVITDLKIFYESNKGPGLAHWVKGKNVYCEVIPEIRFVHDYIDSDTILFVRGGFKHWYDFLLKYKDQNWLMLYAANTGRERWLFWDVILNDLSEVELVDIHGRYWHYFLKPIDEETFYKEQAKNKHYDFCFGASHIHDKKGQWLAVNALKEYNIRYGALNAVMPGVPRRSANTTKMLNEVLPNVSHVFAPGHVNRNMLRGIFNQCKYFMHLGSHGQNDRGPLEAMACGVPVILASPGYHAPFLVRNSFLMADREDPVAVAMRMRDFILGYNSNLHNLTRKLFVQESSFEDVVVPRFSKLLGMMSSTKPTLKAKKEIKEMFDGRSQ